VPHVAIEADYFTEPYFRLNCFNGIAFRSHAGDIHFLFSPDVIKG
jgi:hypothetical protein